MALACYGVGHESGYEVVHMAINLGQEMYIEPVGELDLDLGAAAAQVLDRREMFVRDFALPVLQANAVYQTNCFLGSALARYVIAQELVRLAREEGCDVVAHSAASKGNDQVRMETAIAAQNPKLKVLAPVREWNLKNPVDKLKYARKRNIPIDEPVNERFKVDRNLWGVSLYVSDLADSWQEPPAEAYVLTKAAEQTPNEPCMLTIGFEAGTPASLNGQALELLPLVRELNRLGRAHGLGPNPLLLHRLFALNTPD